MWRSVVAEKKQRKSSKGSTEPSTLSPLELVEELDPGVKEETSPPESKPPSERIEVARDQGSYTEPRPPKIAHVGVGDPPFVEKVKALPLIDMSGEEVGLEAEERKFQDKVEEIRERGEKRVAEVEAAERPALVTPLASESLNAQSQPFRRLIVVTDPATWRHSINTHDEVTFEDPKGGPGLQTGVVVSKGHGNVVVQVRGEGRRIEMAHAEILTARRP